MLLKSVNILLECVNRRIPKYERGKLLTRIKQRMQKLMVSEAKLAHHVGFTPNSMSITGILFAAFSSFMYWRWQSIHFSLILGSLFLLASGYCDMMDGIIARTYAQTSSFGGFMDSLLDRYADALIFGSIILGGLCSLFWGLVALIGSLLVSYTRARAEAEGVKMETKGLAERPERILIVAAASFLEVFQSGVLGYAVILLAALTNITVLQRSIYFYRAIHKK